MTKNQRIFIQFRRKKDGRLLDMPKKDWEDIQADVTRKQEFEFIKEINLDKPSEIEKTEAVAEIPAEPDYDCPLCEFKGKGEVSLKVHKRMKHGYGKEK